MNKRHLVLMLLASVVTIAVYMPGFSGPLVYDDEQNLKIVDSYIHGDVGFADAITGNRSGPLGRPIAMATFVANAKVFGPDIFWLKVTNALLHVLCGWLVFVFLSCWLGGGHHSLALGIAAIWLLLPIHLSTTLYVVQRMTQLSALFTLLTLIFYLRARDQLGANRIAAAGSSIAVAGIAAVLGMYSKENAAALALLLPLVEFLGPAGRKPLSSVHQRLIRSAMVLSLAAVTIGSVVIIRSDWLESVYATRPFDLVERLLSQARVTWMYIRAILVPDVASLGLFNDDIPLSRSLAEPWTTTFALFGWFFVAGLTWVLRKRCWLMPAGLLFFLGGHFIESTFMPLILYFEHRNYLPSIGVLIWCGGLMGYVMSRVSGAESPRSFWPMTCLVAVVFAGLTFFQSTVWGSKQLLFQQALEKHPDSARLRGELAFNAIVQRDLEGAMEHIGVLQRVYPESERMTTTLWKFLAYCESEQPAPPALGSELLNRSDAPITTIGKNAMARILEHIEKDRCHTFDINVFAEGLRQWMNVNDPEFGDKSLLPYRIVLGQFFLRQNSFSLALEQLEAIKGVKEPPVALGLLLFRLYATTGQLEDAEQWLERLESLQDGYDAQVLQTLEEYRQFLAQQRNAGS